MTNVDFQQIEDFRDIESIRAYEEYMEESDVVYLYKRSTDEGQIFVLCNFTREEQDISEEMITGDAEILIGNYDEHVKGRLKAYEAVVYCSWP